MPVPVIVGILVALGIAATLAIVFWHEILSWAEKSLFPWIEQNIPSIAKDVRDAFAVVDKVAVGVRRGVQRAWSRLREYLLKQTVEMKRKSSMRWVQRVTSWVIKVFETGRTAPAKVVTEEILSPDDLPDDIREAYLRRGETKVEVDVTDARDRELKMEMTD